MNDPNFREQRNVVDANENPFWVRVGAFSLSASAAGKSVTAITTVLFVVVMLVILPFFLLWNVMGVWVQSAIFVLLTFWWVVGRTIRAYRKAVK